MLAQSTKAYSTYSAAKFAIKKQMLLPQLTTTRNYKKQNT